MPSQWLPAVSTVSRTGAPDPDTTGGERLSLSQCAKRSSPTHRPSERRDRHLSVTPVSPRAGALSSGPRSRRGRSLRCCFRLVATALSVKRGVSQCATSSSDQGARGGELVRVDGRCPARTGDLLLVRREHLLRSTAVCRSDRSVSDGTRIFAALCWGLSLPQRFHMIASAFTRNQWRSREGLWPTRDIDSAPVDERGKLEVFARGIEAWHSGDPSS
jgi:hypothetical protein